MSVEFELDAVALDRAHAIACDVVAFGGLGHHALAGVEQGDVLARCDHHACQSRQFGACGHGRERDGGNDQPLRVQGDRPME